MSQTLESFVAGEWRSGSGKQNALVNPSTEEVVAETSTEGFDFARAVRHARSAGVALRAMTFAQRAARIRTLAEAIVPVREELIELGIANAGNTRSDAKFDIDGASATLLFYADLGAS